MKEGKGYLFISNGNKPTPDQAESKEPYTVGTFGLAAIEAASNMGYNLFIGINRNYPEKIRCANFPQAFFYDQHCYRNIFNLKENYRAYNNLCNLLKLHPEIEVIHCNTPIGGVLGRICGKKFNKTVIYTAHGFHFYKGAPLVNRLVFKPIEKWLAHKTDCLITINQEDYEAAQTLRLNKGGRVYKVNGVGMNMKAFDGVNVDYVEKRKSLNLPENAVVGIVVGDLNKNKNVGTIIRALSLTEGNIHLMICGFGPLENKLKAMAKDYGVQDRCHFLGFRTDVKELYKISDMFVFASQREGLPRSTMEAMLAGLPCVVSNIRGNIDLIDDEKGGFIVSPKDAKGYANAINRILSMNTFERNEIGNYNKNKIKHFDIEIVKKQMLLIYQETLSM